MMSTTEPSPVGAVEHARAAARLVVSGFLLGLGSVVAWKSYEAVAKAWRAST
jgi:hypothetical protein